MTEHQAQHLKDRIFARCEEVGDCVEWQGGLSSKGGIYISVGGVKVNVRRFLYEQLHGEIPAGKEVCHSCTSNRCLRHLQALTRTQKNKRIAKAGKFSTPAFRAKVSAGKRRNSELSDAAVEEIRAYEGRVADIAAVHGISESYAHMLRRGQFRVTAAANPFAGLFTGLASNESKNRRAA